MLNNSIHAFMEEIIDYAGIFPPSSETLEQAINHYAAYQQDADSWMLARFVMPAARLTELDPYVRLFTKERPLSISATGRKGEHWAESKQGLLADLADIADFCQRHGELVNIRVLEFPLPPVPVEQEWLASIAAETAKQDIFTFCEITIPRDEQWEQNLSKTLDAFKEHNERERKLGVKLRTGGVVAEAFPTPEQIATFLIGCRDRGLGMKFTAGLHHPIRMFRREVGTKMHGFLNVFTAGMFAYAHKLDKETVLEILKDEDVDSFNFTELGLTWRDLFLSKQEISDWRRNVFYSYGSCSFDDPRHDLRMLKVL